ncbi:uncharacterized [Tachysurus ichikawai]
MPDAPRQSILCALVSWQRGRQGVSHMEEHDVKSDPPLHDGGLALPCCHAIGHCLHDGYLIKGIWRQVEQERLNWRGCNESGWED